MPTTNPTTPPRATYRELCIEHYAALRADDEEIKQSLMATSIDTINDLEIAKGLAKDAIVEATKARREANHERRQRKELAEEYRGFRIRMLAAEPPEPKSVSPPAWGLSVSAPSDLPMRPNA